VQLQKKEEIGDYNFSFNQAFEYFLSAKKADGVRIFTVKTYNENFDVLRNGLKGTYPELMKVNELSSSLIRVYLNYLNESHFIYKT
jgi:integrase/recombinase XerD